MSGPTQPVVYDQELRRRLGQQGGQIGAWAATVQPVVIIGEQAALAADPLEARGFASQAPAASTVQLVATPSGGVIIEQLGLAAAVAVQLAILDSPDPALTKQPFMDCGGIAAVAVIAHGPGAAFTPQAFWVIGTTVPVRIFVPSGKVFRAQAPGVQLTYAIQWRELPVGQP